MTYNEVIDVKLLQRIENAQRSRLLQGTASLNRASDSVVRSHQVAAETDQVADEIVSELGTQRESLLRTQDRVFVDVDYYDIIHFQHLVHLHVFAVVDF